MARNVYLMTSNARKHDEYRARLSQYGLHVHQKDKSYAHINDWLAEEGVIAVMRERSNLYGADGVVLDTHRHLEVATNRTTLEVYTARATDGSHRRDTYVREIVGHIDLDRREHDPDVFAWDDCFVPRATLFSYHQMRQRGLKLSARDLVIADYVRGHLWYRNPIQLRFAEVDNVRTIDFAVDPLAFVDQHPIYRRLPDSHLLRRVLDHTLAEGLFFRSARNRREKNYWLPGLNAGVPFVPKRDDVHEATFMFHDLMHFAFPDLIFDGPSDDAHRNVYVVHRMMSEAFTLVLADMVFIDALAGLGLTYDFTLRRIYPLFTSLGLDPSDPASLRRLLWANTRYCLAGDSSPYEALGADPDALASFRGKYEAFFVADFRWTLQNFVSMADRFGARAPDWIAGIAPLRRALPFPTPTVGELTGQLQRGGVDVFDLDALIEAIFLRYIDRLERMLESNPPTSPAEGCLHHGFLRYMMGQLAACFTFGFVPESHHYASRLVSALVADDNPLSLDDVRRLRGFFDQYVDLLFERNLVSDDDRDVFKEVFPVFSPFYVAYDVEVDRPLAEVAKESISDGRR